MGTHTAKPWSAPAGLSEYHESSQALAAFLELIAPCEITEFWRASGRIVYHIRPRQPEHLPFVYSAILEDRKFLDALDIDREDVGLADDHIRVSLLC